MHSLIFDQVSFGYSDEILSDVSFTCSPGWTALVGGNGAGKTTLLGLAAGTLAPVRGTIRRTHLVTVATIPQRVDEPDPAIVELAYNYEHSALRWRARLGLGDDDLERWPTLSPGERKRWQLAAALASEPDLLLVDEPSNHLDADALALATDVLAGFRGVGLLVSHDRALLDRLATQTLQLEGGQVRAWPGNYAAARAAWEAEQASRRALKEHLVGERRRAERYLAESRRREASAQRSTSTSARMRNAHDSDARTITANTLAMWAAANAGRQVQRAHTRVAAAREAETAIRVGRERGAPIAFAGELAARRWVVQLELPVLRAGDHVLAREVKVAVGRDERIWLRGANGSGKTTLLGEVLARCTLPPERVFALAQDLSLDASAALAAELRTLDRASRGRLGQLVDALGIDPERALGSAAPSPGEVRKLALALGLVRAPQLIVLDEPTNHLAIDSIERLEAALADYPGALIVVSHDARFASAVTATSWTLAEGRLTCA